MRLYCCMCPHAGAHTSFKVVEPLSLVVLDVWGQISVHVAAPSLAPHPHSPAAALGEGINRLYLLVLPYATHVDEAGVPRWALAERYTAGEWLSIRATDDLTLDCQVLGPN